MRKNRLLLPAVCAAAILGASANMACADQVLYDQSGFVQGQQSFSQSFQIAGPGTLTVALSNVAWPVQLSSLDLLLTTPEGTVAPEMGAGTATFDVGNGNLSAQWFGTAGGTLNIGLYSLKITFAPNVIAPVPLSTSIAFLISGIALLGWQRRQRSKFPLAVC